MNISADEALFTGESLPVAKAPFPIFIDLGLVPADQLNIVFPTTKITQGRATAIVIATRINTQLGSIANLIYQKTTFVESPPTLAIRTWTAFTAKSNSILALTVHH
jgi:Na+-exporting ATPase